MAKRWSVECIHATLSIITSAHIGETVQRAGDRVSHPIAGRNGAKREEREDRAGSEDRANPQNQRALPAKSPTIAKEARRHREGARGRHDVQAAAAQFHHDQTSSHQASPKVVCLFTNSPQNTMRS